MAKVLRYTNAQIEAARKKLRGLIAQNQGHTRAETVGILSADVRKALQKGYSLRQIREVLAEAGLAISLDRLKALQDALGENGQEGLSDAADTTTSGSKHSPDATSEQSAASVSPARQEGGVC